MYICVQINVANFFFFFFFFFGKRNFIKTTKEKTKDQDKACLQPSPGNQPEQEAPSPQADKKRN